MLSTSLLLAASMVVGQAEASPNYGHLKAFDGLIGTWLYRGPVQEDVPNLPGKDTPMLVHSSWKWIFNKAVVENSYALRFKDSAKVEGKTMYGWNAAEKKIVSGGMNSIGGMGLGEASFSDDGKVLTVAIKSVDGDGVETSSDIVFTLQGEDVFVWQSTNRQGRDLPADSPKYTFKRVQRADDDEDEDDDDDDDEEDDDD
jgi:hypothetical protein